LSGPGNLIEAQRLILSLFFSVKVSIQIFVLIYVDDIIITSSHRGAISKLIQDLHSSFALKDLGPLNFFLGVEASWKSDGLHLSQQRYIQDILKKTNMELVKPVSTPMSSSTNLTSLKDQPLQTLHSIAARLDLFNTYLSHVQT
jgi:hypothetical protein